MQERDITNYHLEEQLSHSPWISLKRFHYHQNGMKKSWDLAITPDSVAALLYHPEKECFLLVKQLRPAVFVRQLIELNQSEHVISSEISSSSTTPSSLSETTISPISATSTSITTTTELIPPKAKLSLELCAGLLDKHGKSPIETMQAEILEECGYHVPLGMIEPITSYYSGAAKSYSIQHLYYVEMRQVLDQKDEEQQQSCIFDPLNGEFCKKVSNGGGLEEEGEMIEVVELPLSQAKELMKDESVVRSPSLLHALSWWFLEKATPEQVEKHYRRSVVSSSLSSMN
ncbi:hypothetical protein C9374_012080 [Naegleria lovaniensis]|uniref:Nudix hydrolase domain-containing protein n=1 Tax=Naegleria lovaniensis TaxID=51637 RepID=A0AA88KCQ2_NAELO|nr:uncharacterized protein C9374_012080 [Naegleria lovaniensis]KAG2373473.1 hypothetical protein C9374_012080 [Naegleria lovaniensis]